MFKKVNPRQNFPEMEKNIMNHWKEENIFEKSVANRDEEKTYSFFDGPPFATGLPHYGHVVASLIKDVVPRFQTMKGKKVDRRWGWDCHGLPIENLIEKENNIKNKQDIEKWGVDNFNNACHNSVLRYADDWKKFIPRIGRWVDMENDYRTMDWKYTESIWWVFSELYKKGLVYEGHKAMHICPRCETTLSNFEVTQGYKIVKDFSVIAKFKITNQKFINKYCNGKATSFLAWTTTPWSLPTTMALAIGSEFDYVVAKIGDEQILCVKDRIDYVLEKSQFDKYEIINILKGKEMEHISYVHPFGDFYQDHEEVKNNEKVYQTHITDYVSIEDGTGIVTINGAFGEIDMEASKTIGLPIVVNVKMNGTFMSEMKEFSGMKVKSIEDSQKTDIEIIKYLAHNDYLFAKEKYEHSYPHCWRCDTPLLNYATSSWFVRVTEIKDKMVENNKQVNWTPSYIKEGRFGKWLEDARDWAISRNRFWGAPLPIWRCPDCENIEVVNSIDELREKTDEKITKLILIRHGESESSLKDITGRGKENNFALTSVGIKQAQKAAEEMKDEKIDIIFSSTILRAKQTAEILNEKIKTKIEESDAVVELYYGSLDGISRKNLHEENEIYQKYQSLVGQERFNFKFDEGESKADVQKRIEKFVEEILQNHQGKNVMVVCHATIIGMFSKVLNQLSLKEFYRIEGSFGYLEKEVIYLDENKKPFNLHKPNIDRVKVKCSNCQSEAKIVGDVFDCWFESGSMPYAQWHYPFENQAEFEKSFPADFIAEGLDQTRGWFYTLMVLSTALFDKAPFQNVIVNGMVLAEDGQKMSKRLKNYPEPDLVIEKYGADALRYYLLSSPVMKGESLRFSERGVDEVLKRFILTLWNTYSFFVMNIDKEIAFRQTQDDSKLGKSDNLLDQWIVSELNILIGEVNMEMENYDLVRASRPFREFIDKLSNWYVRRSRKRFISKDVDDRNFAQQTLFYVLTEYTKLLAPFMPFLSEEIYKNLTDAESVHLEVYPIANKDLINEKVSNEMNLVRQIVTLGLAIRAKNSVKVRMPLAKLKIENGKVKLDNELVDLIKDELNVKEVEIVKSIKEIDGWVIEEDLSLKVALDLDITEELRNEGFAREIVRQIQVMRKEAKYNRDDLILVEYNFSGSGEDVKKVFKEWGNYVRKECLAESLEFGEELDSGKFDLVKESKVGDGEIKIGIRKN